MWTTCILEFHFVASPHNLGSLIIHKKKYNPSQVLEDVGISHFLLAKFHQKVKLEI